MAVPSINAEKICSQLPPSELIDSAFSLEAFRRWMVAFIVCDFNVDIGVDVEYMFPPTPQFSAADLSAICFNSFPERTDLLENSTFHFRFRHSSPRVEVPPSSNDPNCWYGYCYFRQQQDTSVKRNYRQKSLVLISQHGFTSLFQYIVQTLGHLTDVDFTPTIIESACANIASWSPPVKGCQELPFLGSLFNVHIPPHPAFPLQGLMTKSHCTPFRFDNSKDIYTSEPVGSWSKLARMMSSVSELYIIFEQVLLCEPLVILADEPSTCSEFISCIIDLIRPIPYAGDFRPYITIHSDYFKDGTVRADLQMSGHRHADANLDKIPSRNFMLGITNPFFLKRIIEIQGPDTPAHVVHLSTTETRRNNLNRSFNYFSSENGDSEVIQNGTKGYIARDIGFLKQLEAALKDPASSPQEVQQMVRKHFSFLTALFLAPLNRYLATILSTTPKPGVNEFSRFSEEEFFQNLAKYGTSVPFKGKTSFNQKRNSETFYRRFCRSPGFFSWLDMKTRLRDEA